MNDIEHLSALIFQVLLVKNVTHDFASNKLHLYFFNRAVKRVCRKLAPKFKVLIRRGRGSSGDLRFGVS